MPAHRVLAAIAAGLDWLDADVEQYLCEGPGSARASISVRELLHRCGYEVDINTSRIAARALYRLGWAREFPERGLLHGVWRRGETPRVPRPGFEAIFRKRLREHLADRSRLPASLTSLEQLLERMGLRGAECPALLQHVASVLSTEGWRKHIYNFPANRKRVTAWEPPRERAPVLAMRQQIVDAPARRRINHGERERALAHHDTAGGRAVCEHRRGLTMR